MGKLKTWESNEIKRTPSSVSGLGYEITGPAKGVSKTTKGIRKGYIARISKDGQKRVLALSHLMPMPFATGVTNTSPVIPPNTTNGKLNERDKMSSTNSSYSATPIRRKTGLPKPSTGLKSLRTKRLSLLDLAIIVLLTWLIIFIRTHLHISITWS